MVNLYTKTILLLLFLSSFLISCSKTINRVNEPKWVTLREADIYEMEDKNCDSETAKSLGNFSKETKIWILDNEGNRKQISYDLSKYSLDGLKSDPIKNTIIEFEQVINMYAWEGGTTINMGRTLNFCRQEGGYRPDSLENVALASVIGINEDYIAYNKLAKPKKINPVNLLIHPLLKINNEVTHETKIEIENAYWKFNKSSNDYSILLMPMEKGSKMGNLWENPTVTGHEYGHHIFKHHANKIYSYDSQANGKGDKARFLGGINEAFADLTAIYSQQANKFASEPKINLAGRDINSKTLDINDFNLDKIFGHEQMAYLTDIVDYNENTNYPEGYLRQEVHIVGAITTYTFNRVLEESNHTNPQDKLQRIVNWLDKAESNFKVYHDSKVMIGNTLKIFIDDNASDDKKDDLIKELFPAFENQW